MQASDWIALSSLVVVFASVLSCYWMGRSVEELRKRVELTQKQLCSVMARLREVQK